MKVIINRILLSALLLALSLEAANGQRIAHDTTQSNIFRAVFHNLNHHDSIGDQRAVIQDLITISWLFTATVELNKSMEYLEMAQTRCIQIGDSSQLANVRLLLADNYKSLGAYTTAFGYYNQADSLFLANGNTPFHVFTHYCMALCKQNEYEHTGSMEAIDSAIILIKGQKPMVDSLRPEHKSTMKLIETRVLISKGTSVPISEGREFLEEALMLSRKAKEESRKAHERVESFFEINEADALINLGRISEASALLAKIDESKVNETQLAILYPIKYKFYKLTGNYKKALEYFDKNEKLNLKTFNTENASQSHKYTAMIQYNKIMDEYERKKNIRETEFKIKSEHLQTRNNILKVNMLIVAAIVILMIINSLVLRRIRRRLEDAKTEIEGQNAQLMEIHDTIEAQTSKIKKQLHTLQEQAKISSIFTQRMTNTIRLAKPIQEALMSTPEDLKECLKDYFIYWKPVAPVSGDFYWLRKAGRYTYMIVADATGHGVPGAFLSMLGISMMNDISAELDMQASETSTGQFLDLLKERFTSLLGNGNNQMNDSIDLAMIKIDRANNRLQYSGANRPLLMVNDGEVTEFKPTRMCIGYNVLDRGHFASNIVDYEPGDMIYMFSDGLSDQFGGIDSHTKFGSKRFNELLSGIHDLPVNIQESTIAAVFQQWTRIEIYNVAVNQIDDQIIAGIRL